MKYEVQYSSYVNVTLDGFVILKRAVKTESFALQVSKANLYRRQTGRVCLATRCVCVNAAQSRGRNDGRVWNGGALRSGHTW